MIWFLVIGIVLILISFFVPLLSPEGGGINMIKPMLFSLGATSLVIAGIVKLFF